MRKLNHFDANLLGFSDTLGLEPLFDVLEWSVFAPHLININFEMNESGPDPEASGTPTEWLAEFDVNTGSADVPDVAVPQIIGLSNGNFLVAWVESDTTGVGATYGDDIIGKIYDADGTLIRDSYRLNADRTANDERDFDLAATNDGGFIIVFIDNNINEAHTDIIYQRHDVAGDSTGTKVILSETTPAFFYQHPQIAVNLQDNTSTLQLQDQAGLDNGIYLRVLDASGNVTSSGSLNDNDGVDEYDGDIAMLQNGNFANVFTDDFGGSDSIQYIISTPSAFTSVGPFQVDSTGRNAQVTSLTNGNFVVVWEDFDTDNGDVKGWVLSGVNGASISGLFSIASGTNIQVSPDVIALPDGDFVVVWDDMTSGDLIAQRFNADATTDGANFIIDNGATSVNAVSATADGRILFTWVSDSDDDIHASIWDPRASTIDGADYNTGSPHFLDTSVLTTLTTSTTVNITSSLDEVLGQAGDDTFVFDLAADIDPGDMFDGGDGTNTLLFEGRPEIFELGNATLSSIDIIQFGDVGTAPDATTVRMSALQFDTGGGFSNSSTVIFSISRPDVLEIAMDTLTSFSLSPLSIQDFTSGEDIIRIIGDSDDETITGSTADDTIEGGAGADTLTGGTGNDTLSYASDTSSGVTVFLSNNTVSGGDAAGDVVSGFENIIGGQGDDTFRGNAFVNEISGGAGVDTIFGNGGNDVVYGGAGNDILRGGVGDDLIYGGDGNDDIVGNNQQDILHGDAGDDVITAGGGNDDLFGGADNDTLTGNSGADELYGGTGDDSLSGNSGGDDLFGGDGADTLYGGGGNDDMTGGAGADIFVFTTSFRVDRIKDFEDGIDLIDVTGHSSWSNFTDILDDANQVGLNVIIQVNPNNRMVIENFDLADLDASDFIF